MTMRNSPTAMGAWLVFTHHMPMRGSESNAARARRDAERASLRGALPDDFSPASSGLPVSPSLRLLWAPTPAVPSHRSEAIIGRSYRLPVEYAPRSIETLTSNEPNVYAAPAP